MQHREQRGLEILRQSTHQLLQRFDTTGRCTYNYDSRRLLQEPFQESVY